MSQSIIRWNKDENVTWSRFRAISMCGGHQDISLHVKHPNVELVTVNQAQLARNV